MRYGSLTEFLLGGPAALAKGPVAVVMAEDPVEVDSTLRHALKAGFRPVLLLAPEAIRLDPATEALVHRVSFDVHAENAMMIAVNRLAAAAPGIWFHYCYNAEYLFHPFCETRNIRELIAFHTEERRDAVLSYVIDLYAVDLDLHPNAVSLEQAMLDRSGYYALGRDDPVNPGRQKERQLDFFGGLRWRFEEHVPPLRRKIDRIALFRAKEGLQLRPDFTFTDEEYNTYACPWHHNITTAICSFRTAKALKSNPGSTFDIRSFRWRNSVAFRWSSQQLMDLGLMEPGQWF
ncbi:hypothetical protein C5F48_10770 [Cereibacter changlensis JA139]|uniref:Glycosyl transferase family 2 n=2 Tax=Cereibacter changlensis TaxID=402884 RepID=A0A2T4JV05_9RHOB|nr:hypothetical protein [Cereibacter changlensis]PTE21749.1 hypothetical protein C5F48_10770 [Cereibacter changlensis JA139]PZX50320.1 hypothetical protein LX76_03467 [Cereibacter changlensis]